MLHLDYSKAKIFAETQKMVTSDEMLDVNLQSK